MPKQLSIYDLLEQVDAMSAARRVMGIKEWKIRKEFNPCEISENKWIGYYDFFKPFLPELTKPMLKKMLLNYRKEFK